MPIRQEKFQVSFPKLPKEDPRQNEWKFVSGDYGGLSEGEEDPTGTFRRWVSPNSAGGPGPRLNATPSTGIREPCVEEHQMGLSRRAGDSDFSAELASEQALKDGFTHCPMVATDDQYTGQHVDLFYGTPRGSNDAHDEYDGFVERNNYLDRE